MHLSDTAKRFNMGTKTFSRLFDKEVSMTYYQFVKNARIMKGIELILEKKLSGFKTYFIKFIFKTPTILTIILSYNLYYVK